MNIQRARRRQLGNNFNDNDEKVKNKTKEKGLFYFCLNDGRLFAIGKCLSY